MNKPGFCALVVLALCCTPAPAAIVKTPMVRLDAEPAGANCASGGTAIHAGTDENNDGFFTDDEITQTRYVCNGTAGTDGTDGMKGSDGMNGKDGTNGASGILPVKRFAAVSGATSIDLTWVNPPAPFAGTTIRRSTAGFPATVTDGILVYEGTAQATTDLGLAAGTRYFYSAFAHDSALVYAEPVGATGLPQRSGALDLTFNGSGFVSDDAPEAQPHSEALAVAVDAQGRVILGGFVQSNPGPDATVWRYLADGQVDTSFGGRGTVVMHNIAGGNAGDAVTQITVDDQGRLLIGGYSYGGTTSMQDGYVLRLLPDGSLDPSYGTNGVALLRDLFGAADDYLIGLYPGAAGSLTVLAECGNPSRACVARLTAAGARDLTFNGTGLQTVGPLPGATSNLQIDVGGMALDSTGRMFIACNSYVGSSLQGSVVRLTATGAIDTSFSGDGIVQLGTVTGAIGTSTRVIALSGTKIVVAGTVNTVSDVDVLVWQLAADGTPDGTFGTLGIARFNSQAGGNSFDSVGELALDSTGRLVLGGASRNNANNDDAYVMRLTPTGTLDTTFNTTGVRVMRDSLGVRGGDYATGMTLDSAGRIVVAGSSSWGPTNNMVGWRIMP